MPTKNFKVERGSPLIIWVGDRGTAVEIMQTNDSHWFLPRESPTNITVLPFILSRNSSPLNLQCKRKNHRSWEWASELKQWWRREENQAPWKLAIGGFPTIFEVISVGSTVHLAVEFSINEGAIRELVQGICIVTNPGTHKQSTCALVSLKKWPPVMVVVIVVLQPQ